MYNPNNNNRNPKAQAGRKKKSCCAGVCLNRKIKKRNRKSNSFRFRYKIIAKKVSKQKRKTRTTTESAKPMYTWWAAFARTVHTCRQNPALGNTDPHHNKTNTQANATAIRFCGTSLGFPWRRWWWSVQR